MKNTKTSNWVHGVLALGLFGIALLLVFGTYEFTLTEEQISAKISEVLPIEKSGVEISVIKADLSSDEDTVHIQASGSASRLGRTYEFSLSAVGVPEYRFISGEFFFRPEQVQIVRLEQTGGETVAASVTGLAGRVKELFPKRAEQVDELAYAAEQLAPEIQVWLESRAEGAAKYVLTRAPVYTLPSDAKGFAAQAVLDSVKVQNDTLVIKLSLYRLGSWVLIFFFGGLMVLAHLLWPFVLIADSNRR